MHDPTTQAFNIPNIFFRSKRMGSNLDGKTGKQWIYRPALITIWHRDPCKDGTDDSCGWFKRSRHGDQAVLKEIEKTFDFEWDASFGGWFNTDGTPRMSSMGITLDMFRRAVLKHYNHDWNQTERFLQRHLYKILSFAENPTDSLHDSIIGKYGVGERQDRIERFASTIYGYILRLDQPWYRHARWHVWHWSIQIHPWQSFKRWVSRERIEQPQVAAN